jgi:hypothetical protein
VEENTVNAKLRAGLVACIVAGGCGKVSPDAVVDGGPTADQACMALAQAECDKRDSCSNGSNITHAFGEKGVCVTRLKLQCTEALAAPGTGNSPTNASACASAFATLSCNDFFDNKLPAACAPTGARADGQPCAFNGQCTSGFCGGIHNTLCGTCAPQPQPGDSCADSGCGHGQACASSTMTCQNLGLLNQACGSGMPCGNGLSCVATAVDGGTASACALAIGQVGGACGGATMPSCDATLGLHCGGTSGAKTCAADVFVAAGAACGNLGGGMAAQCQAGSCYTSTGTAGQSDSGICKADGADGATCDTAIGPDCVRPARCVVTAGGTSGVCTLPTGAGCG